MMNTTGMKTRKNDGRPTSNIVKRAAIANNIEKKKKKTNVTTNDKTKQNETPDKNSGTSSSENSDGEDEEYSENENENNTNSNENNTNSDEKRTEENIAKNDAAKSKKVKKQRSIFNVNLKSKILLYVRNELFKKIKILGNEHLQPEGAIMQEALKRVQFNPKIDNKHAYMQECKKLLKQTMCSRRGYVKKKLV